MTDNTEFYLVWREGGGTPSVKHHTFVSAQAEAQRLAAANPGSRFVVLKSTISAIAAKPRAVVSGYSPAPPGYVSGIWPQNFASEWK